MPFRSDLFVTCCAILLVHTVAMDALQAAPNMVLEVEGLDLPAPDACSRKLRHSIAWGVSTAAYQIEGGWNEGGRSPSVWDTWSQSPGHVYMNQTGNLACDHYHHWREDVKLMHQLGLKHYRLSISWSRIVPGGFKGSPVNPEGVKFYKQLLAALRAAGIEPLVTLFHWDLPQVLQDEYGGFASARIVEDFVYYADVVFRELGRFVSYWVTFNEPLVTCQMGFQIGTFPPGLKLGNQGLFTCGHHHLLAHARAVQVYRQQYARMQGGKLSVAVPGWWAIPANTSADTDKEAADVMMLTRWAWMFDPLVHGNYPTQMQQLFASSLPSFTPEEQRMLKGSVDYLAVNVYSSRYISAGSEGETPWLESLTNASGAALGPDSDVSWLKVTPTALRGVTAWLTDRYGPVEIRVTENGVPVPDESSKPVHQAVLDVFKVSFYREYLNELCKAVEVDGANITGYYAWSLLDNFEWLDGYRPRFGIVYVDYEQELTRIPKLSALWLSRHFFKPGQ